MDNLWIIYGMFHKHPDTCINMGVHVVVPCMESDWEVYGTLVDMGPNG